MFGRLAVEDVDVGEVTPKLAKAEAAANTDSASRRPPSAPLLVLQVGMAVVGTGLEAVVVVLPSYC